MLLCYFKLGSIKMLMIKKVCPSALHFGNIFVCDAGQRTLALKINKFKKIQTKDVHLTMSKTCSSSKEKLHISKKQLSTTEEKTTAFDEASKASKSSKFPNFLKVMNASSVTNKFLVVSFYFYFLLLFCLIVVSTYYKASIDIFTVHSF